jgi:hypothetical protein
MRRKTDDDDVMRDYWDDVARDGEVVRCPMYLMDSLQRAVRGVDLSDHMPGYRHASDGAVRDAQRQARDARTEMIKRAEQAWRTSPTRDAHEPDAAEELLGRHLRGKPDDGGAPDPGDVGAVMRRHLTERGEEAQRERERAWRQYKDRLSGAWRGRADPREAGAAERNETQLEAWRKPGARPGLRQDATNDSAAAYAAYVERIGRAWRAT